MMIHPEFMLAQVHDHHRELIAEADQHRLLAAARRRRRHANHQDEESAESSASMPSARGRPAALAR
jgi:hypothetical protein